MESKTDFEKLPYYEKIIQSHYHEFEGIYLAFINYKTNSLEYSEFISTNKIKMIMPPENTTDTVHNTFEIIDSNTVQVKLNKAESRYFDYNNNLPDNDKGKEYYTLILHNLKEDTVYQIQNVIKLIKKTETDSEETDSEETDSEETDSEETDKEKTVKEENKYKDTINIQNGGRYFNLRRHYDLTIVYKVYEPIILNVCKYVALFDDDMSDRFFMNGRVNIRGIPQPGVVKGQLSSNMLLVRLSNGSLGSIHIADLQPIDNPWDIFINSTGDVDEIILSNWMVNRDDNVNDDNIKMCCYSILDHTINQYISIQFNMFDLTEYNIKKTDNRYFDRPFNSMDALNLPPAHTLLQSPHNTLENIQKVKIMQAIINKIISKDNQPSGRPMSRVSEQDTNYPNIHLLELLDPNNNVWIMRSEHYHLSKSPCVHNGLAFKGKINYFLKYLNLWPPNELVSFEGVTWLHNIAHALDRLYCGTPAIEIMSDGQAKTYMFNKILYYFNIFIRRMSQRHFPICGIIPYRNRERQNYTELFFYICINDMNSIRRKLSRPKTPLNDGVSDNFLLQLKATSNCQVPFNIGANRAPLIDALIARIKQDFGTILTGFPLFNYQYSYVPIPNSENFSIKPHCNRAPTFQKTNVHGYNCQALVSNNLWREANPRNIDLNDPTLSSDLYTENYVDLNAQY